LTVLAGESVGTAISSGPTGSSVIGVKSLSASKGN
jgi:hypothetical protein